jgi:hypothetical protein
MKKFGKGVVTDSGWFVTVRFEAGAPEIRAHRADVETLTHP